MKHGTNYAYAQGCRCDECRNAVVGYRRELRRRKRMTEPVANQCKGPGPWVVDGACGDADPAWFFPNRGESATKAKAICATCPVLAPCREFGMGEPFGVWGGLSEKERAAIKRQNRRVA
jgi:WhiB family redox-sensing transcriptional regulator